MYCNLQISYIKLSTFHHTLNDARIVHASAQGDKEDSCIEGSIEFEIDDKNIADPATRVQVNEDAPKEYQLALFYVSKTSRTQQE